MDNDWTNADIHETETTSGHNELVDDTVEQPKRMWELRQEPKYRIVKLTQRKHFAMRRK